jgi:hypothetical protein
MQQQQHSQIIAEVEREQRVEVVKRRSVGEDLDGVAGEVERRQPREAKDARRNRLKLVAREVEVFKRVFQTDQGVVGQGSKN